MPTGNSHLDVHHGHYRMTKIELIILVNATAWHAADVLNVES